MLIGINGGYFPAICRACLKLSQEVVNLAIYFVILYSLTISDFFTEWIIFQCVVGFVHVVFFILRGISRDNSS